MANDDRTAHDRVVNLSDQTLILTESLVFLARSQTAVEQLRLQLFQRSVDNWMPRKT